MTWSVIAITFFLIMAVVTFLFKKKIIKDEKTNYKTLFIIGMTWLPLGVAIKNLGFIVGGLVLVILGIMKKDQWRDEKKWSELSPAEKKVKLSIVLMLAFMLVVGVVTFFMYKG